MMLWRKQEISQLQKDVAEVKAKEEEARQLHDAVVVEFRKELEKKECYKR